MANNNSEIMFVYRITKVGTLFQPGHRSTLSRRSPTCQATSQQRPAAEELDPLHVAQGAVQAHGEEHVQVPVQVPVLLNLDQCQLPCQHQCPSQCQCLCLSLFLCLSRLQCPSLCRCLNQLLYLSLGTVAQGLADRCHRHLADVNLDPDRKWGHFLVQLLQQAAVLQTGICPLLELPQTAGCRATAG